MCEHVVDLWINRPMDPDVEFIKAPGSKSWRVCATIDFAVNEIVMVPYAGNPAGVVTKKPTSPNATCCPLYTSAAADEEDRVHAG